MLRIVVSARERAVDLPLSSNDDSGTKRIVAVEVAMVAVAISLKAEDG